MNDEVKAAVNALREQKIISITDYSGVIGEFEAALAQMTGSRYALCMNSGTAALRTTMAERNDCTCAG